MKKTYVTEQQVKEALKIDSFRNITKDKIMEFVSLIPNMDKDVALSIINQFPTYVDMVKCMTEQLGKTCEIAMSDNSANQSEVNSAYKTIIDSLAEALNREDITPEERDSITNKMIQVADKMAEKDSENKRFISCVVKNKQHFIIGLAVCGVAILGVNFRGRIIPRIA
ncbi:hypothetical protein SAMN02910317_01225 [Ruminococcaceae bacterium FB2012]|nr:hypothetical protein SAMN02910317_01225 [Ruminococcaceae bacterium FB2012]